MPQAFRRRAEYAKVTVIVIRFNFGHCLFRHSSNYNSHTFVAGISAPPRDRHGASGMNTGIDFNRSS